MLESIQGTGAVASILALILALLTPGLVSHWYWPIRRKMAYLSGDFTLATLVGYRNVYYPKAFNHPPLLNVDFVTQPIGNIGLELVEQRPDGFRVRIVGYGPPELLRIAWTARGEI